MTLGAMRRATAEETAIHAESAENAESISEERCAIAASSAVYVGRSSTFQTGTVGAPGRHRIT
jgi:hypothetical protein